MDHAVVDVFKAGYFFRTEIGEHFVQLRDAVEDTGQGEAAPVDIGVVGPEVGGEPMGVVHQDCANFAEVFEIAFDFFLLQRIRIGFAGNAAELHQEIVFVPLSGFGIGVGQVFARIVSSVIVAGSDEGLRASQGGGGSWRFSFVGVMTILSGRIGLGLVRGLVR